MRGLPAASLSRLSLQWPLRPENARFLHRHLVQEVRLLTGFGAAAPAGPVWVGGIVECSSLRKTC